MPTQTRARGEANPQFFYGGGIAQSTLFEIFECFGVAIELLLVESGGLSQHGSRVGGRSTELFEIIQTFAKG